MKLESNPICADERVHHSNIGKMCFLQKLARKQRDVHELNVKFAVIKVKYLPNKSWYRDKMCFSCLSISNIYWLHSASFRLHCAYLFDKLMPVVDGNANRNVETDSICHSHHNVYVHQPTNSNWTTRVFAVLTWVFASPSLRLLLSLSLSFPFCVLIFLAVLFDGTPIYGFNLISNCQKNN